MAVGVGLFVVLRVDVHRPNAIDDGPGRPGVGVLLVGDSVSASLPPMLTAMVEAAGVLADVRAEGGRDVAAILAASC